MGHLGFDHGGGECNTYVFTPVKGGGAQRVLYLQFSHFVAPPPPLPINNNRPYVFTGP